MTEWNFDKPIPLGTFLKGYPENFIERAEKRMREPACTVEERGTLLYECTRLVTINEDYRTAERYLARLSELPKTDSVFDRTSHIGRRRLYALFVEINSILHRATLAASYVVQVLNEVLKDNDSSRTHFLNLLHDPEMPEYLSLLDYEITLVDGLANYISISYGEFSWRDSDRMFFETSIQCALFVAGYYDNYPGKLYREYITTQNARMLRQIKYIRAMLVADNAMQAAMAGPPLPTTLAPSGIFEFDFGERDRFEAALAKHFTRDDLRKMMANPEIFAAMAKTASEHPEFAKKT